MRSFHPADDADGKPAEAALPTGTVTFLFSDIEGSTQRWDRDRAAMQQAVRQHDEILRAAISAHGGYIFKTIGDAFCAVFTRAEDALVAALEAQRGLLATDFSAVDGIRVRIALHTGTSDERDGDYFGPAVNRVARLLAIGHGGQVILSGVTADLVSGDLPPHVTLRDLGSHRLRDLALAEQVYQLVAPDLEQSFPALRSLASRPNNLPLQLTTFVGREREVAKITELLERSRIVTLIGTGGVGKTRTSLQVAADALDASPDGVWFVELAPVRDATGMVNAVASALAITLAGNSDPREAVLAALRDKMLLLVLDNCEHLIADVANLAAAIVRGAPGVRILASSREGLGIAGETTYRMPSLAIPESADAARTMNAAQAGSYGAVALFVERALAADPNFSLTDENAPAVAEICRRLDGIALAIELAAARVRTLSPEQLRRRLDERFRILTGGRRDVLPRQQTLRALIDWSHDLLTEPERTLLRRLAVFAGGFTLDSVSEVCSDDVLEEWEILDVLSALVDKSLVAGELDDTDQRYRLLESTRQYAREKLTASGEEPEFVRRHARAYASFVEKTWADFEESSTALAAFGREVDNVRAALDVPIIDAEDAIVAARLYSHYPWSERGLLREAVQHFEVLEPHLDALEPKLIARCLLAYNFARTQVHAFAQVVSSIARCVEAARSSGNPQLLIDALASSVLPLIALDRTTEAKAHVAEARAIVAPRLSRRSRGRLLQAEGFILLGESEADVATARERWREYSNLQRAYGANDGEGSGWINLAEIEYAGGDADAALAASDRALKVFQPENFAVGTALTNRVAYLIALGRYDEARKDGERAVRALQRRNAAGGLMCALVEHFALCATLEGDAARGAALLGWSEVEMRRQDSNRERTEQIGYDRLRPLLEAALPANERESLLSEGATWTEERALSAAFEVIEQTAAGP